MDKNDLLKSIEKGLSAFLDESESEGMLVYEANRPTFHLRMANTFKGILITIIKKGEKDAK